FLSLFLSLSSLSLHLSLFTSHLSSLYPPFTLSTSLLLSISPFSLSLPLTYPLYIPPSLSLPHSSSPYPPSLSLYLSLFLSVSPLLSLPLPLSPCLLSCLSFSLSRHLSH